ncbi:MAG: glycerophosphodiester phosphodiesterase [Kurthia sp.]|nr:glycerophosphodiester phosphodiesterase [Candidatus Kurthia equi]
MSNIPIYAHRGYVKKARENSLQAMKDAMKTAAFGIEFDLQLTKDRVAIVTHDLNMKPLIGISAQTNELTLAEILRKKVKGDKAPILQFSELLSWVNEHNIPMNIELKESFIGRPSDIEVIVKKTMHLEHIHFSSFHDDVLQVVKKVNPSAEVAFIPTKKFDWSNLVNMDWLDVLHVNKNRYYKPQYFKQAEIANKKLRFYGVVGKEPYISNPHPVIIGWITDEPNRIAIAQKKN